MNCDCVKFTISLVEKYNPQHVRIFNEIHKDFYCCLSSDDKKLFKIVCQNHTTKCLNKKFVDEEFQILYEPYGVNRE